MESQEIKELMDDAIIDKIIGVLELITNRLNLLQAQQEKIDRAVAELEHYVR